MAGGDGTVSTACAVALEAGLPLLVIPASTFNHFAADLGVWSVDDALAALGDGEAVTVDVGVAGRRPFINTSSTGIYVDLVHARERLEPALGRRAAVVVALIQVLRRSRPHELVLDGRRLQLSLYFAGNCRYERRGWRPPTGPTCATGTSTSAWSTPGRWPGRAWSRPSSPGRWAGAGSTTNGGPRR